MKDSMFWTPVRAPRRGLMAISVALVALAGCAEDEFILPGKREAVQSVLQGGTAGEAALVENQSRAIGLPSAQNNTVWAQSIGSPSSRTDHPALAAQVAPIWSANIGAGDERKQRIVAAPVVANGVIYTLDSATKVTATSQSGQTVWTMDVRPPRDEDGQATGGGLAYDDGRLYVSLGYGSLVALDATTGGEIWRQALDGTGSGAPTVFGDLVYVSVGDDRGLAISKDDGRLQWQLNGSPDVTNIIGAPSPAVSDGLALFAFGSGEVQAVFRQGGLRRWDASVSGERFGTALGSVGDVTAAPVIVGDRVYVGNLSGRLVALDLQSGARIWTVDEGAQGNIIAAGDSVFVLSDLNELLRLDASDGSRIWGTSLPKFVTDKPKKRSEVFVHHGPLLAGGRIYVASNDGLLRSFDPENGALVGSVEIPGGATSNPVVAGGVLYVVSTRGQLHAFR
ncbi:MAG: PQQ-binding-like beta-propeller repeat protein [Roseobacter sp.]